MWKPKSSTSSKNQLCKIGEEAIWESRFKCCFFLFAIPLRDLDCKWMSKMSRRGQTNLQLARTEFSWWSSDDRSIGRSGWWPAGCSTYPEPPGQSGETENEKWPEEREILTVCCCAQRSQQYTMQQLFFCFSFILSGREAVREPGSIRTEVSRNLCRTLVEIVEKKNVIAITLYGVESRE